MDWLENLAPKLADLIAPDGSVDELRNEMESQECIDLIEIDTVPPPEIIDESTKPMIEASKAKNRASS